MIILLLKEILLQLKIKQVSYNNYLKKKWKILVALVVK